MSQFSNYKFRPSQLGLLMKGGRSKAEPLGEVAKTILQEIFIKTIYGREKIVVTNVMEKGIIREHESISLYRKVKQVFVEKNEERFANDWVQGTPDLILEDRVIDIKTSWDIWTFYKVDEKTARENYYYQILAYMWLTGKPQAELAYCLINNDEMAIQNELRQYTYVRGTPPDEIVQQITKNNTYDDIPIKARIKSFIFEFNEKEIETVKTQLAACRNYLSQLEQEYIQATQ